jgi:hypothetical protein
MTTRPDPVIVVTGARRLVGWMPMKAAVSTPEAAVFRFEWF